MTPIDFAKALLVKLGLPVTENNIAALVGLQVQEGGHSANSAKFNPMNVTQLAEGSRLAPGFPKNGPQIQAYPDWQTGLNATATLFKNGLYKGVLASLARSAPPSDTLREIALSPYGWYKTVAGKRVPLAYPAATSAAAAWRSFGSKLFPDGGGMLETGEGALRNLFTFRSTASKIGGVVIGVSILTGIAIVTYTLVKKRREVAT